MFWPCETRTSTCRNFATISSGLYRFLAITVLLDVKDIPQVGPLQWGWISLARIRDYSPASARKRTAIRCKSGYPTRRSRKTALGAKKFETASELVAALAGEFSIVQACIKIEIRMHNHKH